MGRSDLVGYVTQTVQGLGIGIADPSVRVVVLRGNGQESFALACRLSQSIQSGVIPGTDVRSGPRNSAAGDSGRMSSATKLKLPVEAATFLVSSS